MHASYATLLSPDSGNASAVKELWKVLSQNKKNLKGLQYMTLLLVTAPIVSCLILPLYLVALALHFIGRNFYTTKARSSKYGAKTVLVTGAPHTKGLQMCRFLKSAGHKVILADMNTFQWNAARFSFAVDEWVSLPNFKYDPVGYENAVKKLILDRGVDWWVPVSHTVTAPADCSIKTSLLQSDSKVKVLSYDSMATVNMLDDKIAFLEECQSMGLAVPEFHQISSVEHIEKLRDQGLFRNRHFFLKPLFPYSEDRVNFDRIPDEEVAFRQYLRVFEQKISPLTPYFVSEYVKGPEYTGNCVSSNGKMTLFTCNPSSPMQIDYDVARGKEERIYEWTREFCQRKNITGNICFDFMEDEATGRMLAIECNPRLHSCIVLLKNKLKEAGEAIGDALEGSANLSADSTPASWNCGREAMVVPEDDQRHVVWLYNELGKLAHVKSWREAAAVIADIAQGEDAVFDLHDPLPFFVLGHIQLPVLIWGQIKSGKKWNILNFCLGQLR